MKNRVFVLFVIALLSLMTLTGCNNTYKKLEGDGVKEYLDQHYNGDFTIVSTEKLGEEDNDGIIYSVKDKEGIEFSVLEFFDYQFFGSHYAYYDNYSMATLENDDAFSQTVRDMEYFTESVNEVNDDSRECAYYFAVSEYDEIESLMTDIHTLLTEKMPQLPYNPNYPEDVDGRSIKPEFLIYVKNDYSNNKLLSFFITNEGVATLEEFVKVVQWNYTNIARDNKEPLPDEVLIKYPPEKIADITYNGNEVQGSLYYGRKSQNYGDDDGWCYDSFVFWDNGRKVSDDNEACVRYRDLESFLTDLGYKCEYNDNSVIYTSPDGDIVTEITDKGDNGKHDCRINGEVYKPEGNISWLLRITEVDMENMFGITFEIDLVNAAAEVLIK